MRPFLFDTNIFLYAVGADHPYREPCRAILTLAREKSLAGDASIELIHEFAHLRMRRSGDIRRSLAEAEDVASICRLHDFERRDLGMALQLIRRHQLPDFRDGIFAATALNRGIDVVLSADSGFDVVDSLERVDPADRSSVEGLVG